MTRRLLPHAATILLTFTLALAGLILLAYNSEHSIAYASASAGDHLEVAPVNSTSWAKTTGAAWTLTNAAPGESTTGGVQLRSLNITNPTTTSLRVRAIVPGGAIPGLAAHLVITEMHLGSVDLLPDWQGRCGGAQLTLAALVQCEDLPALPAPAGGPGESFTMTILFDGAAGNAYQGASAMNVTFAFTLVDTTPGVPPMSVSATLSTTLSATPVSSNTPSPTTTSQTTPAPSTTRTATTAATSGHGSATTTAATSTPGATMIPATTPIPPASGSGVDAHHAIGLSLLGLALVIAGGWLAIFVAARRRTL